MALFKRKYHDDMYVNGIYLRRYIKTEGANTPNEGEFICPDCGEPFVARITSVSSGNTTSCGCKNKDNLIGQHFGKLTVVAKAPNKNGRTAWYCQCDCGNSDLVIVQGKLLKNGGVKSCGCLTHEPSNIYDLTGQRFGKLVIIKDAGRLRKYEGQSLVLWECKCDCGGSIVVSSNMLRTGKIQSCGCDFERSKGQKRIREILKNNNVDFIEEYSFINLKNPKTGYVLRFDFYIPAINTLIEYDGKQHQLDFKPSGFFTRENLDALHERDALKNRYCQDSDVPLVRISYKHYDDLSLEFLCKQIPKFSKLIKKIGGGNGK